ncbi:MAG TPA: AMP-binding protein, partial [Acidimicrobiia bacterium]
VVRQTGARGVLVTPELSERRAAGFRTVDLALSDLVAGPHPAVPSATAAGDTAYVTCVLDARREPRFVAYAHRVVIAAGDPIRYGLLRLTPEDTCLVPEELSAPFAFDFALGLPLSAGARALVHQGSDDAGAILSAVERHAATILVGTPRLYQSLGAARPGAFDLGSLRLAVCLGEGLPEPLQAELRRHFGLDVVAAAATPETHVFAATADGDGRSDTLGFPLPGRTVEVLTERGDRAATGQVGELCFPPGDPALAVGCGGAGGWYRSGLLASRDDDGSLRRATS